MEKEFIVYKEGKGNIKLLSSTHVSGRHIIMGLESDIRLQRDDAIWAVSDMDKGDKDTIMIIHEITPYGSYRVAKPDQSFLSSLRDFEDGESFKLIASWRNKSDEEE